MSRSVEPEISAPETPRRSFPLRAAMLVPLWAAVVIGVVILIAALPGRANKWDYSIYYSSALAMREGMNPYTTDLTPLARSLGFELKKINHATDPPTFVMCFVPLTLLAPRPGFYVWTAINAGAFLLALILLFRWTPGLGRDAALAIAALTILFPPVLEHLIWGQNKMLVLLMFVLMLRWMERGRDAPAGLILAFASLLRIFPLLLVGYLILMKRWRVLAYTMVGLAVGGLVTLALVGIGRSFSFLLAPRLLTEQWAQALPGNIALATTMARMFWYFFGVHLGATLDWTRRAATWGAELGLLALTVRATVARPSSDDPEGRLFILWIMTAILASPTSWFYYLVLLALPMVKLSAAAANERTSRRALWAGVACYTLAWLYFTAVDMKSQELALHPNTLVWRVGASPVGLLAYLSLYWFATDPAPADQRLARSAASQSAAPQSAAPIDEARTARIAVSRNAI
ncbi:MAG TPA: glycosyltransferase family 87 protein [Candidatus Binataceae bacterium]|nr:glycosyltransferase family 87 protein [Candidatus Binataceae bacterium]